MGMAFLVVFSILLKQGKEGLVQIINKGVSWTKIFQAYCIYKCIYYVWLHIYERERKGKEGRKVLAYIMLCVSSYWKLRWTYPMLLVLIRLLRTFLFMAEWPMPCENCYVYEKFHFYLWQRRKCSEWDLAHTHGAFY